MSKQESRPEPVCLWSKLSIDKTLIYRLVSSLTGKLKPSKTTIKSAMIQLAGWY